MSSQSRLLLVFHLIGQKDGACFLNQSKSVIKEIKVIPDYFRQSTENYSVDYTTTGLRFASPFFNLREFSKPIVEQG